MQLLPSHIGYTKFIILARSRTGSNLLRGLLNAHPAVVSFGEIFRNADQVDWDAEGYRMTPRMLKLYRTDPLRFVQAYVYRRMPKHVQAVGFKLFYYHARTPPWDAVWTYLQRLPDLKVIHLKRRNILRTHLSRARAVHSDHWVNLTGESEDARPLELRYEDCLYDFIQTRRWEMEADQFFPHQSRLELFYEDLAADYQRELARVQAFLCLPAQPAAPRTHKQAQQPLSAAISNYRALKERFAGTEWADFFEE